MEHAEKLIHITKMPIRWGDMDAYGHVNNTVYFRYMEQARVEWIEAMAGVVRPGGDGPGDHQRQLHLPDTDDLSGHGRGAHLCWRDRPLQFPDLRRNAHRG
jgi:hypothetical protein